MANPDTVMLESGALRMALAPAIGGAVTGFWHGDVPLMRETPEHALRDSLVRQTSCYPLIPYSNRIAHGRFTFDGAEHELALNFGEHPHSIHGNGWQRPWHIAERTEISCRLTFSHDPVQDGGQGWPFAYRADQTIRLDPAGDSITLSLTNRDERPMPAGFGLHPFFPRRPRMALRFRAGGVYRNGADSLPISHDAVPEEWNFRELRTLDNPGLDNCFSGWDGDVEIRSGSHDLFVRIEAEPIFGHLVVYIPDGRDFFAIEPVSHANDAVNRPADEGNGFRILQPGETLTGAVRFSHGAGAS
jgi:aldose 1-epimerase